MEREKINIFFVDLLPLVFISAGKSSELFVNSRYVLGAVQIWVEGCTFLG